MTSTRIIQSDNWTISSRTDTPSRGAPESKGRPFPKQNARTEHDATIEAARAMVSDIVDTNVFRVYPGARAHHEARIWGPFPDESSPVAVDHALSALKQSLSRALGGLIYDNRAVGAEHLDRTLETLHALTYHADAPNVVAPLHTMLDDSVRAEVLARLAFSYAELSVPDDAVAQRRVQRYLDLLIEELPDPAAGEHTSPRQRFLKMFAHIYMARSLDRSRTIQEAIKQLETALEINDLHMGGIEQPRLEAHAALVGLLLKRAFKLASENKRDRVDSCVRRALEVRASLEHKMASQRDAYRARLVTMRADLARALWHLGYVREAYEELFGIQSAYGTDTGRTTFDELLAGTRLSPKRRAAVASRFIDGNALRDPHTLDRRPLSARALTWGAGMLANAHRTTSWNTIGGWFVGSGVATAASYAAGHTGAAELLAVSGLGATAIDVATRLMNGSSAPATRGSTALGLDLVSPSRAATSSLAFGAHTLLPWTLFGGPLPLVGLADQVPFVGGLVQRAQDSSVAAGSLYGPGALFSGAFSALGSEPTSADAAFLSTLSSAYDYYAHVARSGLDAATQADALGAARAAYEGTAIGSLAAYGLSAKVRAAVDGRGIPTLARRAMYPGAALAGYDFASAINANPLHAADATDAALKAYAAAALGYFFGYRLSPAFRAAINEHAYLKPLGPMMLPGGFLVGANLGVALGANPGNVDMGFATLPMNSIANAATGAAFSALGQTLIGNKRPGNLQWGHMIGASLIINGYIGVSANFAPAEESRGFAMVAESAGRQIGMLPMMVAHGAMQMVDPRRFAENKVARLVFFDHFGNVVRIGLGAWDGALPVVIGTTINFGVTNALLGRMFNDGAGSKPIRLNYENMLRTPDGIADERILRGLDRGLRRIPATAPLTKMCTETLMLPVRALSYSIQGKKLAPFMIPEEKTYRVLHDMLMDDPTRGGLREIQVKTLLSATGRFLERPDDADVQRGLMRILAGAQKGPHGEQIRHFIHRNRDVRARLRLELDPDRAALPHDGRAKERLLWNELQHPYRVAPHEQDYLPHTAAPAPGVLSAPLITAPMMSYLVSSPVFIRR